MGEEKAPRPKRRWGFSLGLHTQAHQLTFFHSCAHGGTMSQHGFQVGQIYNSLLGQK